MILNRASFGTGMPLLPTGPSTSVNPGGSSASATSSNSWLDAWQHIHAGTASVAEVLVGAEMCRTGVLPSGAAWPMMGTDCTLTTTLLKKYATKADTAAQQADLVANQAQKAADAAMAKANDALIDPNQVTLAQGLLNKADAAQKQADDASASAAQKHADADVLYAALASISQQADDRMDAAHQDDDRGGTSSGPNAAPPPVETKAKGATLVVATTKEDTKAAADAKELKDAQAMANTMRSCSEGDITSCTTVCNWGKPGKGVLQPDIDYACGIAHPKAAPPPVTCPAGTTLAADGVSCVPNGGTSDKLPPPVTDNTKLYIGIGAAAVLALLLLKR